MRRCSILVALAFGCGGPTSVMSKVSEPAPPGAVRSPSAEGSSTSNEPVGSSDGTTCEEARDKEVEEIDLHGGGAPDLTAQDLGTVLDHGAYLASCEVPQETRVKICVAVKNGAAAGVTVALDPPNPEMETCVSKEVRGLTFPAHPKLDIAVVRF